MGQLVPVVFIARNLPIHFSQNEWPQIKTVLQILSMHTVQTFGAEASKLNCSSKNDTFGVDFDTRNESMRVCCEIDITLLNLECFIMYNSCADFLFILLNNMVCNGNVTEFII